MSTTKSTRLSVPLMMKATALILSYCFVFVGRIGNSLRAFLFRPMLNEERKPSNMPLLDDLATSNAALSSTFEPKYRRLLDPIEFPPIEYSNNETRHVALCTSMTREHLYVSEWLDYHLALGFSDIYISDNSPNSSLSSWNGTRSNRVHVYSTPNQTSTMLRNLTKDEQKYPHWQFAQNNDCTKYLKQQPNPPYWVAFFDADEFVVLYNETCGANTTRCQHSNPNIVEFLTKHVPDGAMQINWVMFGTSRQSKSLDFPVLQRFRYRDPEFEVGTKMVVRLEHLRSMLIHTGRLHNRALYKRRHFGTKEIRNVCCVDNVTRAPIALYHYYTKSLKEFQQRRALPQRRIFEGTLRDDTAWNTLTRLLPQYKALEDVYEQVMKETYQNQTGEYERLLTQLQNRTVVAAAQKTA